MENEILTDIYSMLTKKQKMKLYDDWGIDSLYDLNKRIKDDESEE